MASSHDTGIFDDSKLDCNNVSDVCLVEKTEALTRLDGFFVKNGWIEWKDFTLAKGRRFA